MHTFDFYNFFSSWVMGNAYIAAPGTPEAMIVVCEDELNLCVRFKTCWSSMVVGWKWRAARR